jgi:hypothetical protein
VVKRKEQSTVPTRKGKEAHGFHGMGRLVGAPPTKKHTLPYAGSHTDAHHKRTEEEEKECGEELLWCDGQKEELKECESWCDDQKDTVDMIEDETEAIRQEAQEDAVAMIRNAGISDYPDENSLHGQGCVWRRFGRAPDAVWEGGSREESPEDDEFLETLPLCLICLTRR